MTPAGRARIIAKRRAAILGTIREMTGWRTLDRILLHLPAKWLKPMVRSDLRAMERSGAIERDPYRNPKLSRLAWRATGALK